MRTTGTCACHIILMVVRKLNEIRAPLLANFNNQTWVNYADEIQFSRFWLQIAQKRKPKYTTDKQLIWLLSTVYQIISSQPGSILISLSLDLSK